MGVREYGGNIHCHCEDSEPGRRGRGNLVARCLKLRLANQYLTNTVNTRSTHNMVCYIWK